MLKKIHVARLIVIPAAVLISTSLFWGICTGIANGQTNPWSMRGHDSRHTGQSEYIGSESGVLKWRYQTGSVVYSSPAIDSDGTVYVGSDDHYVYALNPDGTLKWRYQTGSVVYSSPAIGSDGTVYVGSDDHYVYALNPDGTLKWRYQTGSVVYSSPAIGSDDTIYVGSWDYYVYALHPDGTLKWRFQTGSMVDSSPAIGSDGTVYVGSVNDRYLHAINTDGTLKWRFLTDDFISSSPAIGSDGTVYVGSYDSYFYALNPDGTLNWRYQTGDKVISSPAIGSDGTVYVGSNDSYFYALNPDGTLKWRYQAGGAVGSSPAIGSDGTVYVGSSDYYFYTFQRNTTTASIRGTVFKSATQEPLTGVNVYVEVLTGTPCAGYQYVTSVPINQSSGTYQIDGLSPGTYYLRSWNTDNNYVNEWWSEAGGTFECSGAQTIVVTTEGQNITGKNFQLAPGGTISGRVTAAGGAPTQGVSVSVYSGICYENWIGGGTTNAEGLYTVSGLPGGLVYAYTGAVGHFREWWDGEFGTGTSDCNLASPINVSSELTTSGVNFQLNPGAVISGKIYQSDGIHPVTGLPFPLPQVFSGDPCGSYQYVQAEASSSQSDGNFWITVQPGTYYLRTSSYGTNYQSEWWASTGSTPDCHGAQSITTALDQPIANVNFQLDVGGAITGRLYDQNGTTPITGESLWVMAMYEGVNGGWYSAASAPSNPSDGTYTISGIPPGTYRLETYHDQANYIDEMWASAGSVRDSSLAEPVTVHAGDVLTGKDFQLEPGAVISGQVYRSDGTPLTNTTILISAFSQGGNPCWHSTGDWGMENQMIDVTDGTYSLTGLYPGTYFLKADALGLANYTTEWWASAASTPDCTGAQTITVPEGQSVSGKDFQLDDPYRIDTDGDGLSDGAEEGEYGTNPFNPDTDGDTVSDSQEITDGTLPNDPTSYLPSSAEIEEMNISPEIHSFLRKRVDGVPQELSIQMKITGGVPFFGEGRYYQIEVIGDRLSMPVADFAYESGTEGFGYPFDTSGKEDGIYFVRAKDITGRQVVSKAIFIHTIATSELASYWGDAGADCSLSVSGTGSPFDGSTIAIPAAGNPGGMQLSFNRVESGAPFVSGSELLAHVILLEATDGNGDPVSFPVNARATVVFPYEAMIGSNDPFTAAVIHYNEASGRWERVIPLPEIDSVGKTMSFQTDGFSLFAVVVPAQFRFSAVGGASQNDFNMISIPGQPLGLNLRDHLEAFLGAYDDTLWRLFAYDRATGDYLEATDANLSRFEEEFSLAPGRSYWMISRYNKDIAIPSLSFDKVMGSAFHTILYPGWNMISQPWAEPVHLFSHDIEVSTDGSNWIRIDYQANPPKTEKTFWRFLRREGSGNNWYEELEIAGAMVDPETPPGPPPSMEQSTLLPDQGYWIRNLTDRPVFLRMTKKGATASIQARELPGELRMLAVRWLEKAMSGDRACIAASAGDQPPDPPLTSAERRTIGVAGGGGGGCFIRTVAGSQDDSGSSVFSTVLRKADTMTILLVSLLAIFLTGLVIRINMNKV